MDEAFEEVNEAYPATFKDICQIVKYGEQRQGQRPLNGLEGCSKTGRDGISFAGA